MNVFREHGHKVSFLEINEKDGDFTFPPISSEKCSKLLVSQVSFNKNNYYCFIDGGYGAYIGVIRFVNPKIKFLEKSDDVLKHFLINLIIADNFNWVAARKNPNHLSNGLVVLSPFTHKTDISDKNASVENLVSRIKRRVRNDSLGIEK